MVSKKWKVSVAVDKLECENYQELMDFFTFPSRDAPLYKELMDDSAFKRDILVHRRIKHLAKLARDRWGLVSEGLGKAKLSADQFLQLHADWASVYQLIRTGAPDKRIAGLILARLVARGRLTNCLVLSKRNRALTTEELELFNNPLGRIADTLKETVVFPSLLKQEQFTETIERLNEEYQQALSEVGSLPRAVSRTHMPARGLGGKTERWQLVLVDLWGFANQEGIASKNLMTELLRFIDPSLKCNKSQVTRLLNDVTIDLEREAQWWMNHLGGEDFP
jgi:hypothetical protein